MASQRLKGLIACLVGKVCQSERQMVPMMRVLEQFRTLRVFPRGGTVRCRPFGGLPGLLRFLSAVERRPRFPSAVRSSLAIPSDRG